MLYYYDIDSRAHKSTSNRVWMALSDTVYGSVHKNANKLLCIRTKREFNNGHMARDGRAMLSQVTLSIRENW